MALTSHGHLSQATLTLWAKSDRGKESDAWHPLICHLLDVAASCYEIISLEPQRYRDLLAIDFHTTAERAVALTVALVGLHDLGKANAWFQRKSESCVGRVKEANFDFPPEKDAEIAHGIISQAFLYELLPRRFSLSCEAARLLADAVGAHHGYRTQPPEFAQAMRRAGRRRPLWKAATEELFDEVWEVCDAPDQWSLPSLSAPAFQRLMGLTSVADWIGSSLEFAAYDGNGKGYFEQARGRARERLRQVGWQQRLPLRSGATFGQLFSYLAPEGSTFEPRGLQKAVVELLEGVSEPVLLLVEAPMGEGKTEASFYAHVAIQNAVGHRGAYIGLPSQATGNAMFERLHAFLEGQGRKQAPDLQLLHGAQLLNDSYQDLRIKSNVIRPGEDGANVVAQTYFSHLKRALLSEYGAGTIDQALLGILGIKHQFVRLWGLGNRTVILDEVHAYDTYTSELLLALVRWLRSLGSSVILMSATLPRATRQQMLEAFAGAAALTANLPYPRVALVHQGQVREQTFLTRPLACFELHPAPVTIPDLADQAAKLVEEGGCLACIVNTVDRAQQLYLALEKRLGKDDVMLFHARFPIEQKQKIEEMVLARFGKGDSAAPNPDRPRRAVLVATQVVEQSLDLDFDVMVTDLAPIDLILQRAGRLHRHDKNTGGRGRHETAKLLVAGLASEDIRGDCKWTYWEVIYNAGILVRSWLRLKTHTAVDLNSDLDPLVQCVYDTSQRLPGQEPFDEFLESNSVKAGNEQDIDQRDASFAELGNPDGVEWQTPPRRQTGDPDDPQGPLLTRKTQETVTVVPVYGSAGEYYLDPLMTQRIKMGASLPLAQAKVVFGRTVKISRIGIVKALQSRAWQPWSKTALLQNVYPLYLDNGRAKFSKTTVSLHPDLGLVYEKEQSV
jgi:CRISPR-associated endonuclease/helicase Cas3